MISQMLRPLILSLIVVFSFFSKGKLFSQSELSTKFIGDRFSVYNGQVNYKIWSIAEFFVANSIHFNLSVKELLVLRNCNKTIIPKQYLFEEESYWIQQSFRDVSLLDSSNSALRAEVNFLISILLKELSNPKLSLYQDPEFVELLFKDEVDTAKFKLCTKISVKETWYYDKVNNKLDNDIIGFGLEVEGQLLWLYYPKLKSVYKYLRASNQLSYLLRSSVFVEGSSRITPSAKKVNDFTFSVLEKMNKAFGDTISEEGQKVTLKMTLGSGETMIVNYLNQELSGEYIWKYKSGQIRNQGIFNKGLRVGEVKLFYNSGKVKSIQNYKNGFMDGKQQEFGQKGEAIETYYFVDKILTGTYVLSNNQVNVKGQFVNGLCTGEWRYELKLPELWKTIVRRNIKYFEDHYKFESSWNTKVLLADLLSFSASFNYTDGDDCLNNKCLNVEIQD
jgi:antitoxin component YwqK of YwqJK toxin-antitoxin module